MSEDHQIVASTKDYSLLKGITSSNTYDKSNIFHVKNLTDWLKFGVFLETFPFVIPHQQAHGETAHPS
jgi:hypothetical protein